MRNEILARDRLQWPKLLQILGAQQTMLNIWLYNACSVTRSSAFQIRVNYIEKHGGSSQRTYPAPSEGQIFNDCPSYVILIDLT